MKRILVILVLALVVGVAYVYFLPDPLFPVPLSSVTAEHASLVWQECDFAALAQLPNHPAQDESLACFGHSAPTFVDDDSQTVQFIDKTDVRIAIDSDVYEARAQDLVALTLYTLYKNSAPIKNLIGPGDTLWLHMFLSNVNGRVAWGIANENPATIIYDGKDLRNVYGLDKAHAAYSLAGKLIFVGEKNGKYFVVYDGRKVGPEYDQITIGYCCETALYTARGGQGRYQFRGARDGKNYIVEISPSLLTSDDRERARNSLETFFALLHDGRYAEAIRFYGGDYQTLRDYNPDVPANDYALLFERGCRQNGLMCLEIRSILQEVPMSTNEIRYTVEFTRMDGKLFVRGPCCGATEAEMPSVSRFDYTVKKVGDLFLVQGLPVYVP